MSSLAQSILEQALSLPPTERAHIADQLLESLDRPDPALESRWADEIADRIRSVEDGSATTLSEEEVFADLDALWGRASTSMRTTC
jgi:putative addiction module component (TIGR02574 family)